MNVRTENSPWLQQSGSWPVYPSLENDLTTELVVMGGGITGALMAWHLREAGLEVTVVDARQAGAGSTAASTAMLQYEIDTPLTELSRHIGEQQAVRCYKRCEQAILKIEALCGAVGQAADFDFARRPSFYYATHPADVPGLQQEYALRRKHGFALDYIDAPTCHEWFPHLPTQAALYTHLAAQMDPFRLAQALHAANAARGGRIYSHTPIVGMEPTADGLTLTTDTGCRIYTRRLIIASGYESLRYLSKPVVQLHATYAALSKPLAAQPIWHENALIWETARPYLYLRTTADGRIILGGQDAPGYDPQHTREQVPERTQALIRQFEAIFPDIPFELETAWGGAFGNTADGLPYIGMVPERPHTYFALGFGGNGIIYSVMAAELIRDHYLGRPSPDYDLFRFGR